MANFNATHNQAFQELGARAPYQQWSAFDVNADQAKAGAAKLMVTSIWNFHRHTDAQGQVVPAERGISQDVHNKTYWYKLDVPVLGESRIIHVAHYNRIRLAFEKKIPVVGVLKDFKTNKLSTENLFDCVKVLCQSDQKALWIQLLPRGAVGCEVGNIDIKATLGGIDTGFGQQPGKPSFEELVRRFAQVETRPDQAKFRDAVFRACGGKCVVSDCDIPEALDAAHLTGRDWKLGHNNASDGVLLRRDLHGLYDRGLLVLTESGGLELDPKIEGYYGNLRHTGK